MDGNGIRRLSPLYQRLIRLETQSQATDEARNAPFLRILREADSGDWQLVAWANDLGISEEEMLIELDRHVHRRVAS
jgi:hypothetical protein